MRNFRSVALVAALVLVLAACGGGGGGGSKATPTGKIKLGGTLVAARAADAQLWDPAHINENDSLWAGFQTNANLILASPDGKGFQPYIAQSWEVSPDGRVFTFHLFPEAKFCDGSPITADDVEFSFQRASKPDAIVSWQYPKDMRITAQDPQTVVITLPEGNASFLSYLTLWGTAIVSKSYAEKVGDKGLADKPLGSGPFCLASWQKGSEIDLTRNPHFWLKDKQGNRLPYLDEVRWRIIQDDNARVLALQSGEVDVITPLPPSQVDQLKSAAGLVVGESPLLGTVSLFLQLRKPELADEKVRQALNYAVDKEAIVKAVLFGHGLPALSSMFLANYTTEKYGYPFNLDKAKQLMAQSKFPNGFSASVTYTAGDTLAQQALTILKDQWAKIGVNVDLKAVEEGIYFDTWGSAKWDMIWVKATNDIFDPAENLHFEMMGKEGGSDSGWSGYENPQLNQLVLAAEKELDTQKRASLYNQIQQIYMAQGPQVYLFHPENLWATRDDVHGFEVYKTGLHPFMFTWKS